MNVLSVRKGEAINDQRHSGSEAGSPVSDGMARATVVIARIFG